MQNNKERDYVQKRETFEQRMARVSLEEHNNRKYKHKCFELIEGLMGLDRYDLLNSRKRHIVLSRHLLHYALRTKTTLTLEAIGKLTERDHATVVHGVQYIEDYSKSDAYVNVLKKCIDREEVPELFKTRELFVLANNVNRTVGTRVEGIYNVIFKNINLFQYENADILKQNKVPGKALREKKRSDRLKREMLGT
jgi:hypothetical protein